jgi:CMP-N-acetylneuraminic acid synthetase
MKHNAFIFARGGSKGLKKKNIKIFAGKPLIAHSIEQALTSGIFNNIFVSTEDDEIAEISSSFGADIIHRPPALAQDDSSEWLAWRHAVLYAEKNFGLFDGFISLPPTSPLRNQADILGAVNLFEQTEKADICLGISESSRNPYFNMVEKSDDQSITLACKPTVPIIRRQDAPIIYDITTVIYAAAPSYIKNYDGIFAGSVIGYKIPKRRAIDIDDILDFKFAEFLYDN